MQVKALDHVNVVTEDIEATVEFYTAVLGLDRRDAPPPVAAHEVQWMYDLAGHPLVHIAHADRNRARGRTVSTGQPTGSIDHVAFACTGYAELIARLKARGLAHRVNTVEAIGLRQVFVRDPNNVMLELNFDGD